MAKRQALTNRFNLSLLPLQFVEVDRVHDEILRKKEELDREKQQRHLFRFHHMGMWTKLRPGIWNFLEKVYFVFDDASMY